MHINGTMTGLFYTLRSKYHGNRYKIKHNLFTLAI